MAGFVITALSGGVDSAVSARLLQKKGFRVEAVTMLTGNGDDGAAALAAARTLGIPCDVLDLRDRFRAEILRSGRMDYLAGRTPNPCARCNRLFKFGVLADYARSRGAEALATGHYAQLLKERGVTRVRAGEDDAKNQVYFLALTPLEALNYAMMPLGEMTKDDVRRIADCEGLGKQAARRESQDVCAAASGLSFPETLAKLFPETSGRPGEITDTGGRMLGRHRGLEYYTIGQRKGLGVAMGSPAYVTELDPVRNRVVLSTDRRDLMTDEVGVEALNILDRSAFEERSGEVQFRYRQRPLTADWQVLAGGRAVIRLSAPAVRPAPGQVAAFYRGRQLLAGGIITGQFRGTVRQ